MFVKALRENDDALKVIALLRDDIIPFSSNPDQGTEEVDFVQLKTSTDKLRAYSHLFSESAVKELMELGTEQDWVDNDKEALALENADNGVEQRNLKKGLGDALLNMLNGLESDIKNTINELQNNEIAAAWAFAKWQQDSDAELIHLDEDEEKKTSYLEKMQITLVSSKAREDKSWEIYFESATTLNNTIDDCNAKRAHYAEEKERREEENQILDDIIRTFIDKVSTMDETMRGKMKLWKLWLTHFKISLS